MIQSKERRLEIISQYTLEELFNPQTKEQLIKELDGE